MASVCCLQMQHGRDTRREGVMRFHSRKLDEPASLVTGVLNQEGDVCCSLIFGFYEHREFK
ncbi:hypothetical protein MPTK1_2g14250 [Marchantia polymorpha subsp. ruderalis]|uniref:Uncharacterized protein n=1 Tax=Marchantia polymorpha TaxID=3197 RepID=A0A2R6X1Q6_MARPO|nr:hypothetical protein MARPO_0042s0052 [Marchantia polymorpha]BBN02312.1 hypothetical protein Mp_2g14250 [Marchantia polymorpha subsp. ruderalis]|eukprot:PTQ40011.1 hypothetical protein MARPO_0042s0052 [Marchantia polymorpha]